MQQYTAAAATRAFREYSYYNRRRVLQSKIFTSEMSDIALLRFIRNDRRPRRAHSADTPFSRFGARLQFIKKRTRDCDGPGISISSAYAPRPTDTSVKVIRSIEPGKYVGRYVCTVTRPRSGPKKIVGENIIGN